MMQVSVILVSLCAKLLTLYKISKVLAKKDVNQCDCRLEIDR